MTGGHMKKKLLSLLLISAMILSLVACGSSGSTSSGSTEAGKTEAVSTDTTQETTCKTLERDDWADNVKTGINDFLATYGKNGEKYDKTNYAVFDWDNTCSIFDVGEQLFVYEIQTMSFGFSPDDLEGILTSGLNDLDKERKSFSEDGVGHSYREWIDDIETAYSYLWNTYGPFTPEGISDDVKEKMQSDSMWLEFAAKYRAIFDLVCYEEEHDVADPYLDFQEFTGMTEDEAYNVAYKCFEYYNDKDTTLENWTSPASVESKVGVVSYDWMSGSSVTKNIVELFEALDSNGINTWICSAGETDAVRAAVDFWGLHDYCDGIIAMTVTEKDGVYIPKYDYDTGYAWTTDGSSWVKGNKATKATVIVEGKVTAINNVLVSQYGHGPIAGFMDSSGDFNFCTEYSTLRLVTCFNRANRAVTDGGGLVAEAAVYEQDTLGYDFTAADEKGETYYTLQGRDENGKRSFVNSRETYVLGSEDSKLFKNENNKEELNYMIENKMTVKDIFNTFALYKDKGAEGNPFDFAFGFIDKYSGYHSIQ